MPQGLAASIGVVKGFEECAHGSFSCGSGEPGIVRAEIPEVAFDIAAGVAATTVALVVDINGDLRAGGFGASVVCVAILNNCVRELRFGATDLIGLLQCEAIVALTNGAKHDHAGAEGELGVGDSVVVARDDEIFFKAECVAKPVDGGGSVAIAQAGNDG